MNVVELSIEGNDRQETREGYNIFKPFTSKTITANEVAITINEDNTITLNGTCTKECWIEILYNFHDGSNAQTEKIIDLDPIKKYTFSLQKISGKVNNMYVNATFQLNAEGYGLGGPTISTNSDGTSKTTQGTEGYDGIYRTYLFIPQSAVFTDLVFGVQVEEGETMTEYEPYGAMPSPLYPSKVETVNTQASVVVSNKNFFDKDTMKMVKVFLNYDTTAKENFKLITAESEDYICYIVPLPKAIRNFTISAETFGNRGIGCGFVEYPKLNMEADQYFFSNNNYKGGSYTANEDINYVMLFVCNDGVEPVNLMIEEGNTATEYVPFMLQTKVVDIQQEMLEGDYFVKEEDGWKEVHGWAKVIASETKINATYFDAPSKAIADTLDTAYFQISSVKLGEGEQDKTLKNNIKSNYFKNLYTGDEIWGNVSTDNSYLKESIALEVWTRLRIKKERLEGYTNDLTNTKKVALLNNYIQQQYNSGNPIYFWYKLATPTKLTCTEKQVQQLEDLLNTSTYKNVTHIYSTDKVSPIIKVVYRKDTPTLLNNIFKLIVENGGN